MIPERVYNLLKNIKLYPFGIFLPENVEIIPERDYYNEELLYKMFGINAELLIDHAWGYEPVTIADIRGYKPETNSIGSGPVLHRPYDFEKTKLIVREMTDALVLDLVEKQLVTDQIVLDIG